MNDQIHTNVERYEKKASRSSLLAGAGAVATILLAIASRGYSSMAEKERQKDPVYKAEREKERIEKQKLREQELETERKRYEYEKERLRLESENRKLDKERERSADILSKIDEYKRGGEDMDDYSIVDAAYSILDMLKSGPVNEQNKYRAMSCLSEFKNYTKRKETDYKIDSVIAKIEVL